MPRQVPFGDPKRHHSRRAFPCTHACRDATPNTRTYAFSASKHARTDPKFRCSRSCPQSPAPSSLSHRDANALRIRSQRQPRQHAKTAFAKHFPRLLPKCPPKSRSRGSVDARCSRNSLAEFSFSPPILEIVPRSHKVVRTRRRRFTPTSGDVLASFTRRPLETRALKPRTPHLARAVSSSLCKAKTTHTQSKIAASPTLAAGSLSSSSIHADAFFGFDRTLERTTLVTAPPLTD